MDQCVLCGGHSDAREHVYPTWLLETWDSTGPFTARINGEPVRSREGKTVLNPKMWRVMLPCCSACNGALDKLFEKSAKGPIRQVLEVGEPLNDQAAIAAIARWAVKTLALASHPAADQTVLSSRAYAKRKHPWEDYPRAVLDAIRAGSVPADTSLWFAVTAANSGGLPDPHFEEVLLRSTSRPDGMGGTGHARTTGFGMQNGKMVWFQLVYHPLHDFDHPFERAGLATRLWPDPPRGLDVKKHPELHCETRLADVFVDDGFRHQLRLGQRSHGSGLPSEDW